VRVIRTPGPGEVHIWRAALDRLAAEPARRSATLSDAERARAARLADPLAAARYTSARVLLRELLGGYLEMEPQLVQIRYGPHGKPCLDDSSRLHFNVSHVEGEALLAFTTAGPLGIDIERIRPLTHAHRLARRAFHPDDLQSWLALPEEERLSGFFERWTRMEALSKLLGHGVWRLLQDRHGDPDFAYRQIHFLPVRTPSGFVASLAVEANARPIRLIDRVP